MVNASELRIGNWIEENEKPFKVDEIRHWYYSDAEPIPLTPEILGKAGFVKDRNGFALPNKMSLSFSVTKEFGYLACWEDKLLHLPYDINHLHQLQNLYFALIGEELEINL